ncbi:MAG: SGNH/GDSL hydrolase family protein [Verrucomicrobiota bacterium]
MKNVYIIGDSISLGYTPEVTRLLDGRVRVTHNPGNAQYSSFGLRNLKAWLGEERFDLIHFNWGCWDRHYLDPTADPLEPSVAKFKRDGVRRTTPEQYAANLEASVKILQTTGARLVWASSTPLRDDGKLVCKPEEVAPYNAVAARVMVAHGIAINDLYACALPDLDRLISSDGCHFTDDGYRHLSRQVATVIQGELAL